MKKLLSILLAILMVVTTLTVAFAAEDEETPDYFAWKDLNNNGVVDADEPLYSTNEEAFEAGGTVKLFASGPYEDCNVNGSAKTTIDINGYYLFLPSSFSGSVDVTIIDTNTDPSREGRVDMFTNKLTELAHTVKLTFAGCKLEAAFDGQKPLGYFFRLEPDAQLIVTDGVFFCDPTEFLADGLKVVLEYPYYYVKEKKAEDIVMWNDADDDGVVDADEKSYESPHEAFADGGFLKLATSFSTSDFPHNGLADPSIVINKDTVLDLNGYTISSKNILLDIATGVANVEIYDSKNSGGMHTADANSAVIIVNDYKTNCTIKNGTYMGSIIAFTPFNDLTRQNTSVIGGTFSHDPYLFIKDTDLAARENEDGTFTIAKNGNNYFSASIEGENFAGALGAEIKPEVTVTDKATGEKLTLGKDYTIVYENNIVAESTNNAKAIVKYKGEYGGRVELPFKCGLLKFYGSTTVALPESADNNTSGIVLYVSHCGGITSENATFTLAEEYPYVEIVENSQKSKVLRVLFGAKAGIVKVKASFGGHTIVQEIEITKGSLPINDITVTPAEFTYNGQPQVPTVSVKGFDESYYTVSYKRDGVATTDLTSCGLITVVVTGAEDYPGTAEFTYTINHALDENGDCVCGFSSHECTFNGDWKSDSNGHWKVCDNPNCNEIKDYDAHTGGEATCKEKAVCSVCNAGYGNLNSKNHKNILTAVKENTVASTCSIKGSYENVVRCGDCTAEISREKVYTDTIPHTEKIIPGSDATCEQVGYTDGVECSVCGSILVARQIIPVSAHKDDDGDLYCDFECGYKYEEPSDPTPDDPATPSPDDSAENCDHLCHKGGFMGFIWKIVRFFSKLFKSNPVCECGAAHY